jgi:hypothetical protein
MIWIHSSSAIRKKRRDAHKKRYRTSQTTSTMSLFAAGRQSLLNLAPRFTSHHAATQTLKASLMATTRRTLATARRKTAKSNRAVPNLTNKNIPDHALAMAMPTSVREMDNSTLITLAAMEDHEACSEMLIRHIMTRERSSYTTALRSFYELEAFHKQGMTVYLLPYQVGVATAVTAAFCSIPLVFHLPTVHWFNELYVTTDIPEPQDLETWLEVGSWSWNWMEPPLGQISFFLLCLQFSRYVTRFVFGLMCMHRCSLVRRFCSEVVNIICDMLTVSNDVECYQPVDQDAIAASSHAIWFVCNSHIPSLFIHNRAQLSNLGIRPYTRHVKSIRTKRLQDKYPQYDARIVGMFSKTARLWQ